MSTMPSRSATAYRDHAPLLITALLILYGSLWPFRFVRPGSHELALREMLAQSRWWTSLGDVAGNVLLFVPIGIAIVVALRSGKRPIWFMLPYFAAALLFALGVQFLQLYVPQRDPNLADVLWNAIGAVIGLAAGYVLARVTPRLARSDDVYAPVAVLVVLFWLVAALWPFVPTLDFQQIKDALKPLVFGRALSGGAFARHAFELILLACTLAIALRPRLWLVAFAAGAIAAKPFLVDQTITWAQLAGTVLGLAIGLGVQRMGLRRAGGTVLVFTLVWFALDALRPFEWHANPRPMQWVPFAAMLRGAMGINLASLAHAAFVSGALMLIGARNGWRLGALAGVLGTWFFLFEFAQQWIPTRSADITIALLPFAWWFALSLCVRRPG